MDLMICKSLCDLIEHAFKALLGDKENQGPVRESANPEPESC